MDVIEPTDQGLVDRDGVGIAWERYGSGEAAVTFPPCSTSRTAGSGRPRCRGSPATPGSGIDPRGNGRSDRPSEPEQFDPSVVIGDIVASLDAADIERTVWSQLYGSIYSALVAGLHPERVAGIVHIGSAINLTGEYDDPLSRALRSFEDELDDDEGWATFNVHVFLRDWPRAAAFFIDQAMSDAHSRRPIEEGFEWALEAEPASTAAMMLAASRGYDDRIMTVLGRIVSGLTCPQLVVHGTDDRICDYRWGQQLAAVTGAPLHTVDGGGHCPQVRYPTLLNGIIQGFVAQAFGEPDHPARAPPRRPRPQGAAGAVPVLADRVGHARGTWPSRTNCAPSPPTSKSDPARPGSPSPGSSQRPWAKHVHDVSRHLAGESAFLEGQAGEYYLHVFEVFPQDGHDPRQQLRGVRRPRRPGALLPLRRG